jgi:Putative prokaryotic signal transducing protein
MDNRFVTIASFLMPHEAEMAASFLEEKGIPTQIRDNNTNPMGGGYVEIRLQVPQQNADDALELLDTMMDEGVDLLEDIEDDYKTEPAEETGSNWKESPDDTQTVVCPRCLSINSHKPLNGPVPGWLNAILLGIPGLLFPAKLQCQGCGAVFKP